MNRRIVCAVGAGYVWWPDVGVAKGPDPSTIGSAFYTDSSGVSTVRLSTWVDAPSDRQTAVIEREICPVTLLEHPLSGDCDECQ